jgi:hypothetical protein
MPPDEPAPVDADELSDWMATHELGVAQTADMFGVSRRTVCRWLTGASAPPGCLRHAMVMLSIEPRALAFAIRHHPRTTFGPSRSRQILAAMANDDELEGIYAQPEAKLP